ncbi:MAG: OsmC family protein [Desulfobacteraceae bacterium]|nr:OsmC family protein [Desulfobacteraceae bacterium]
MQCECKIRDFPTTIIDEPPKFGGSDQGANPIELFLSAIGGCFTIVLSGFESMMGLTIDSVEVSVKGHIDYKGFLGLDQNVPPGLSEIMMEVRVKSPEAPEKVKELLKSAEIMCPVLDTVSRSVRIEHENFVNDEKI